MKNITKKLYFRLTVLFSGIFLLAFIILSLLSLVFFYRSLKGEDDTFVSRKILSYWAGYQNRGLNALLFELYDEDNISGDRPFLIRIADGNNRTLLLKFPDAWQIYDVKHLEHANMESFSKRITLDAAHTDESLEVTSVLFTNDLLVQLGISNGRRIALLRNYQKNMLFFVFGLTVFCLVTGAALASRALSPIKGLNRTLQNIIDTGDLMARVDIRGSGDDLDELGALFNAMLERIAVLIERMKDTVNAVAHDLKTPLTRLRGTAEIALLDTRSAEGKQEALADVIEASEEILSMLNSIMDINEAETGILRLKKEELRLADIIIPVTDIYQFIAEEKGITFEITDMENIAPVSGDPVRLRQALGNLLDNAIKFSPEGSSIIVTAGTNPEGPFLSITDKGKGIPEKEQEFIFNRLYRGSNTAGIKGTGLGLSLVKAIMAAHNGKIEVFSEEGKGSRFLLQFKGLPGTP